MSTIEFQKIIRDVWQWKNPNSTKDGKNLIILGSVHGNEHVPAAIISEIVKNGLDIELSD